MTSACSAPDDCTEKGRRAGLESLWGCRTAPLHTASAKSGPLNLLNPQVILESLTCEACALALAPWMYIVRAGDSLEAHL